ncbi:LysR substrate-binding domain-containing protein [Aestuariivirga sp.]|uniref:LysR substrate-binding domain-containing protein n=1 Tax=Aestuariivirga sp. TaxID=2650926 RepID=UPI0039187B9C
MAFTNLPTDVLRTYLAVIDLESFTKAGRLLGRTQPAVSLQIHKLEELVGSPLLDTSGRGIVLTPEGEVLARHARQLLALNDEIVARLQKREMGGRLRVGLPTDYAVSFFQKSLSSYVRQNPDVEMSIHCDISDRLLAMFAAEELDLAIAMFDDRPKPGLIYSWAEKPIWVAASDFDSERQDTVPIAAHPEGCHYRSRMTHALDQIGRAWRITYSSPGVNGLQQAVQSGLGVTALTRRTLLRGMRILGEKDGFPTLPDIHLGLHFKNTNASTAALMLVNYIMQALHDSGQTGFIRLQKMDGTGPS